MYRAIVARRLAAMFDRIEEGDWAAVGAALDENVRHVVWGRHPLSGERKSRAAFEAWLQRLLRLLPELSFEVQRVAVTGWPWDTWGAIHWRDRARLADGSLYENFGVTWVHLRWGKAIEVLEYMDTEAVAAACRRAAAAGLEEGAAAPLLEVAELAE
jgi:ketosteroid isomerase-like protein